MFFKQLTKSKSNLNLPTDLSQKENLEEVCIVGSGLVGLSTLAYLMQQIQAEENPKKKFKITLLDKRPFAFERSQKIIINPNENIPGIDRGIDWKTFCLQLFDPLNIYAVTNDGTLIRRDGQPLQKLNEREKFIRKLLRQRPDVRKQINFSIKSLQKALFEYIEDNQNENMMFEKIDSANILDVNLGKRSLKVEKNNEVRDIKYNTLILCDGEKREVTNQASNSLAKEGKRPFQLKPIQHSKSFHAIVRLKLKPLDKILNDKSFQNYQEVFEFFKDYKVNREEMLKRLQEFGWTSPILPTGTINTNFRPDITGKRPIFGLSCEIPEAICHIPEKDSKEQIEKKNQKIIEWSLYLAAYHYNLPIECFEFDPVGNDQTSKLRISTFAPERKYLDRPVVEVNDANIVTLGESAMTSYHPPGKSAQLAMNVGMETVNCLMHSKPTEPDRFEPVMRKNALYRDEQIRKIYVIEKSSGEMKVVDPFEPVPVKSSKLYDAVRKNDLKKAAEILASGEEPNILLLEKKETPLNLAIRKGHLEMAQLLLQNGANPNMQPSPLLLAVEKNNLNAVNLLFAYGTNPRKLDFGKIKITNFELVEQLVFGGVDIVSLGNQNDKIVSHAREIKELVLNIDSLPLKIQEFSRVSSLYMPDRELLLNDLFQEAIALQMQNKFAHQPSKNNVANLSERVKSINNTLANMMNMERIFDLIKQHKVDNELVMKLINHAYIDLTTGKSADKILEDILVVVKELISTKDSKPSVSNTDLFSSPSIHLESFAHDLGGLIKELHQEKTSLLDLKKS